MASEKWTTALGRVQRARVVSELETQSATDDPDADREYRQAIQRRFTELVADHRAKNAAHATWHP
jgi:hypothetical protein